MTCSREKNQEPSLGDHPRDGFRPLILLAGGLLSWSRFVSKGVTRYIHTNGMIYTPMKVGYVQGNQKETLHLLKSNLGGSNRESGQNVRQIVQYAASQPASRDELKIGIIGVQCTTVGVYTGAESCICRERPLYIIIIGGN